MTRTLWEAEVTRYVDEATGGNFDWDSVPGRDWEAAWLARQSAESFAAELLGIAEAEIRPQDED